MFDVEKNNSLHEETWLVALLSKKSSTLNDEMVV